MGLSVEEVVRLAGANVKRDVRGFIECPYYDGGKCNNCDDGVDLACNLGVQKNVVDSYVGCGRYLIGAVDDPDLELAV